jgi:hypothetical protein
VNPKRRSIVAGIAVALLPAAHLAAHHSPAAYDMQAQVTVAGTVADYDWGNPHVYVSVREDGGGRTWVVEGLPSTAMKQYGWSPQTLALGERVVVTGNPGRNAARSVMYLRTLRKADAVLYDAAAVFAPASRPPAAARASGLAGTWSTQVGPAFVQFLGNQASLPVTPKGAAAMAAFLDTVNPGLECVPFSAPIYMLLPGFRSIEVRDDVVLIRGEDAAVERVVRLGVTHAGATASVHGHSVGRWEGKELVVDTRHFAAHRIGNGGSLPSGAEKHLVERFAVTAEGGLAYSFVLEDPEYLTAPVTGSSQWTYRPDVPFVATPCSADNARRFLAE